MAGVNTCKEGRFPLRYAKELLFNTPLKSDHLKLKSPDLNSEAKAVHGFPEFLPKPGAEEKLIKK
jgi:hypothetical protein